jgi:threonine synthase
MTILAGPSVAAAGSPLTAALGPTDPLAPHLSVNVAGLRCRACGAGAPIGATHVCAACFGPLEVAYDEAAIAARVSRARIEAGPRSLWRYGDLLPVLSEDPTTRIDLGTGATPLRPAPRLAARLGLGELWLKDDTRNPTGSFKDRVVTIALSAARALGVGTLACASTGNLATSVAAHAAAAGMPAYVIVPADLEQAKIAGSAIHGARVIAVDGSYDDVNRLCAELTDVLGWGFVNINLRPFYAEGSKTIGFEIAEQLGWELPDHLVGPIASGAMFVRVHEAFAQLQRLGLVDDPRTPRFSGAQATGCSPVATAFERDTFEVVPQRPDTIARSLAIGNPADGEEALRVVAATGGAVGHVPDDEIVAAIRLLAETEGLFAETAGGVTIANLVRFARQGHVRRDERVVAVISGNGYKTLDAIVDHVGPSATIAPSLAAFQQAIA